jgi:hypothetical protein
MSAPYYHLGSPAAEQSEVHKVFSTTAGTTAAASASHSSFTPEAFALLPKALDPQRPPRSSSPASKLVNFLVNAVAFACGAMLAYHCCTQHRPGGLFGSHGRGTMAMLDSTTTASWPHKSNENGAGRAYEQHQSLRQVPPTARRALGESTDLHSDHSEDAKVFQAWIKFQQNPPSCDPQRVHRIADSSAAADMQTWKNTLLDALMHNKVLASGRYTSERLPRKCDSRNVDSCILEPISKCVAPAIKAERMKMPEAASTCAVFNTRRLSHELGLKQNRSLAWFHAQTMRYLFKPQEHILQSLASLKAELGLKDMSRVLGMHVADASSDDDDEASGSSSNIKGISPHKYAKVARTLIFWGGFDVVLIVASNPEVVETIRHLILRAPINSDVKVVQYPQEVEGFRMATSPSSASAPERTSGRLSVAREGDDDDDDDDDSFGNNKNNNVADRSTAPAGRDIFTNKQLVSELQVLSAKQSAESSVAADAAGPRTIGVADELMAMALMAQSGGFIGTLNAGFSRSVWDLVNSMPPIQRGMLYDMEKRPYFGCPFGANLPLGGGNTMFPFG